MAQTNNSLVIKLSGESLGDRHNIFSLEALSHVVREVALLIREGYKVAVVVGGGNIYRGKEGAAAGLDLITADEMGMAATLMNGRMLQAMFNQLEPDIKTRLMTAHSYPKMGELYVREKALSSLNGGRLVIFSGGTGNPLCTTDSAAALRAIELGFHRILKATNVDGVYDMDPKKNPQAVKYDKVTFDTCIEKRLGVMDDKAFIDCRDHNVQIRVFDYTALASFLAAARGEIGTLVYKEK